jgi:hypothetical protein
MRVFGLGRGARPSGPDGCVSCSTGSSVARAETDWAARAIQLRDRGGSGWYYVPDGARDGWHPAPGHNREWNSGWVPPHWGANPHYGVWAPYGGPAVPTYWIWGASGGAVDNSFEDWRGPDRQLGKSVAIGGSKL